MPDRRGVAVYVNDGARFPAEVQVLVDGDAFGVDPPLTMIGHRRGGGDGCLHALSGQHGVSCGVKPGDARVRTADSDTDFVFIVFMVLGCGNFRPSAPPVVRPFPLKRLN